MPILCDRAMISMATPASCVGPGDPNSSLHTWTTGHLTSLPSQLLQLVSSALIDRSSLFHAMKIPCNLPFPSLLCNTLYLIETIVSWYSHSWSFNFRSWSWDFLHLPIIESCWEKWHIWFPNTWTDRQPMGEIRRITEAPEHRLDLIIQSELFCCIAIGVIIYFLHPSLLEVTTLLLDTLGIFSSLRAIIH